ncbi:hypothetical protein AMJ57_05140 [Parcubacteria bacterium SG8_24]|nr:MAG: hypothetical protein AMJ57_05140 [Parcubacteria bacterium SG8_24]
MPAEVTSRERDLVLAPGEYALILNETKGEVNVYVGPHKTNLDATDRPVAYDANTRQYVRVSLEESIKSFSFAGEGAYIVLENPAAGDKGQPKAGSNSSVDLQNGRKVNIPGPVTFPLWPGQASTTLDGHRLRSNQYAVVRVYNEEAAKENWGGGVMKPAGADTKTETGDDGKETAKTDGKGDTDTAFKLPDVDLTIGQLLVIKGTDVSFYIPPTGIEVVPDERGNYVRDAMTLERLEYCILLDENGAKRFLEGPDVVFPKPTETFVEIGGERKFKAIELNEDMGLFVKVIADYEEGGCEYRTGDELFITGKDQKIYFPREEHSVIKYGNRVLHYGVAIPMGEGRYVLDKKSGDVGLVVGPELFLPDPRHQVVVRRMLDERTCSLLYPGNDEALEHNRRLLSLTGGSGDPIEMDEGDLADGLLSTGGGRRLSAKRAMSAVAGDAFSRSESYAPPRSITLNTKYDGAVKVNVWTGYAVKVINAKGESRVAQGPNTVLLAYDETLEVLALSTGKPKNTDRLERTVYLRVGQNHITDIVSVQTSDDVNVKLKLSYRVNFEGDSGKWFDIENYVKYLCDHIRSMMRHVVKLHGVEEFKKNYVPIVRDTILGRSPEEGKERPGMTFAENGMRIYEVEVLDLVIGDAHIDDMLTRAQHEAVSQTIELAQQQRRLEATKRREAIEREIAETKAETERQRNELELERVKQSLELTLSKIASETQTAEHRLQAKLAEQGKLSEISEVELARDKTKREQEIALAQKDLDQKLLALKAEVQAVVDKAKAIDPAFISALQSFGDKFVASEAVKALSPLAILGGDNVLDLAKKFLDGTVLASGLSQGGNGQIPGTKAEIAPEVTVSDPQK